MSNSAIRPKVIIPPDNVQAKRQFTEDEQSRPSAARSVTYDIRRNAFVLTMHSGVEVRIPLTTISELRGASNKQLQNVTVGIGGDVLESDELDAHIFIPGLLRDVFGLNEGQRNGGRSISSVKAAASRTNGRLGGRPRKPHAAC
jgi:hypothetical protein